MPVALSVVHVYNGTVSVGKADGDLVAETLNEPNKVLIAAQRKTVSLSQQLALRATSEPIYCCRLYPIGKDAGNISLSYDGVQWLEAGAFLFFETVDVVNTLFHIKCYFPEESDYGDVLTNYLQIDYLAPVSS